MNQSAILRWSVLVFLLLSSREGLAADPAKDDAWRERATPAEIELVDTVKARYKAYEDLYNVSEKIEDPVRRREYEKAHDPDREFVPKLMAIEKQNRGTRLGLLACRKLVHFGGGAPEGPNRAGLGQVLEQLPHYVDDPLCVEFIRYLDSGSLEPAIADALKKQIANERANPVVRDACQLVLARYYLDQSVGRDFRERRLKELDAGDKPRYHFEHEDLSNSLARYPDWAIIRELEDEAVSLLKQLVAKNAEHRLPLVTNIDPDWVLIRLDDRPNTNPRLAEMADGVLFKELHLKVGKTAPDLKLKLLSGQDWSLHAQRGRMVILQFSFKGCGPCEGMYPDLRELAAAHPDDLAILSIMVDEEEKDSIEAVDSGKMTWNVSWDGYRGPTNTRWGVKSYPTVYVIDREGRVAGYGLRGEELKKKVAALIAAANP